MVFEKIFAKLFGKKEENVEAVTETTETVDSTVAPATEELKVNAEIKSVDSMNVGGLEGVEPATKNLSEEEKEKITSFDGENAPSVSEEAPASVEETAAAMTEAETPVETKSFDQVKTNESGEIVTEITTEEPTATPAADVEVPSSESSDAE